MSNLKKIEEINKTISMISREIAEKQELVSHLQHRVRQLEAEEYYDEINTAYANYARTKRYED